MHPQRPPTVRQQDLELWKIDCDVVDINGITIFIARAGEDRCAGVKHHGNSIRLGSAINDFQFLNAAEVVIGVEQLVGRMNFDHANPESENLLYVGQDIGRVPRVQTTAGDQSSGTLLHVVGDELIDTRSEADYLGSNIVNEHGTIDARFIQMFQKSAR